MFFFVCLFFFCFFVFFVFGVDGRLWVAGGGGVRCVWCNGGGLVVMVVSLNVVVVVEQKK